MSIVYITVKLAYEINKLDTSRPSFSIKAKKLRNIL